MAIIIKFLGIVFQYGLLLLLLYFIYKVVRYMQMDGKEILEDVYSQAEITNEEAVLAVVESGDDTLLGRRFAFSHQLTIGRSTDSDISISDSFVSHHHAQIVMVNNQYVLEDLGSSNGTYLNGEALAGKTYLQTGDEITIGTVTFSFAR